MKRLGQFITTTPCTRSGYPDVARTFSIATRKLKRRGGNGVESGRLKVNHVKQLSSRLGMKERYCGTIRDRVQKMKRWPTVELVDTEFKSYFCIVSSRDDSLSTLERNSSIYPQSDYVILQHNTYCVVSLTVFAAAHHSWNYQGFHAKDLDEF